MLNHASSKAAAKWWADKIKEGVNPTGYHMAANMAYGGASILIDPGFADMIARQHYNETCTAIDRFAVILASRLDERIESGKGDDLIISSGGDKQNPLLKPLSGRKDQRTGNSPEPCKFLMDSAAKAGINPHLIPSGITMWFSKDRVTVSVGEKLVYASPTATKPASSATKGSDGGRV